MFIQWFTNPPLLWEPLPWFGKSESAWIYTTFIMEMNRSEAYRTAVVRHREVQAVLPPSRPHVLSTQGSAVLYQTQAELKRRRASPPPWPCEPAAGRTLWRASRDGCSGSAGPPEPPAAPGSVWAPDLLWPSLPLLESESQRQTRGLSQGVRITALDFEPLSLSVVQQTVWSMWSLSKPGHEERFSW